MSQHLDLEEQEQLEELKHFWKQYGNLISWLLIVVMGSYAGWNAYQYWQRSKAAQSSAMYDEVARAALDSDTSKLDRALADMKDKFASTSYAQQAALLAAKTDHDRGNADAAKVRLPLGPTPGYGVSAQSKNKAAAKKFIAYLQRPEVNRAWALAAAQLAGADIDAAPQTPGNSEAIRELLVAKRTVLYLDRAWPNARIQPVYMAGVQQLFAGQTTIEALLKRLDDAYALGAQ